MFINNGRKKVYCFILFQTFLAVLRDYGIHCDLKRGDVILHMQPVSTERLILEKFLYM